MGISPVKVFIAYSREDRTHLEMLRKHLSPFERAGYIEVWYDGKIQAGTAWDETIREKLLQAETILLLLSADAIASKYFYEQEVTEALERHRRGEARVVPFILRPCVWQATPLGMLQAIPKDGRPVVKWDNHDDAYLDGVKHLQQIWEEWRGGIISMLGPAMPVKEALPAIPEPVMNPLGDLSAYSCDRKEIIKRFWLSFLRNEEQQNRLQFYFMAGQQYGKAGSMVKRLMINLKNDLKKRRKVVKCSPNLKDIMISEIRISDKDSFEDCRDLLRFEFNRKVSSEVDSLYKFVKGIDQYFPAFSPAQYIPFAFKIKITGRPSDCWAKAIRPALNWFVREYCYLEEDVARCFLFFFVVGIEQPANLQKPGWSWWKSVFKKREEPERQVFNLLQALEAFAEQCPVSATVLPPLRLVRKEDLVEWFLLRTNDNERLAEERAETIIQLLQEKRNVPHSQAWYMDDVELFLNRVVEEERNRRYSL